MRAYTVCSFKWQGRMLPLKGACISTDLWLILHFQLFRRSKMSSTEHSGLFPVTCHYGNVPDLFRGDCPSLPDSLSSWAFFPLTVPMATALFLPRVALAAVRTTLPTSCDPQRIPGLVRPPRHFQSVNAIVSSAHCVLLGIAPAPRRYTPFSCLTKCRAGFPPTGPWKASLWAGVFEGSSGLCEGKKKNKELLNGLLVVNEKKTRAGLDLRATYLDWKFIFFNFESPLRSWLNQMYNL